MAKFVDQPGVPLVSAEIECAGAGEAANVVLSQERYRAEHRHGGGRSGGLAISRFASAPRLARPSATFSMNPARAFASTPARPGSWATPARAATIALRRAPRLVRRLSDDVAPLSSPERMALVSDEWSLARSIRHDIGVFLDLASGFRQERTSTVMETLTRPLGTIGDYVAGPPARPKFRAWMSQLLWPALERGRRHATAAGYG